MSRETNHRKGKTSTAPLDIESRLRIDGYNLVAGTDEVGRGCLAGPVVAAAVILPKEGSIQGVTDSKRLSANAREYVRGLIEEKALSIGVGICSPEEIDRLNILQASMEAMRRAVAALDVRPDYILVDGNRRPEGLPAPAEAIIKGDLLSQSIAAASIIAKTTRDRLMKALHDEFPDYGWDHNVGYPTARHYEGLARAGITPFHRRSFRLSPAVQDDLFSC